MSLLRPLDEIIEYLSVRIENNVEYLSVRNENLRQLTLYVLSKNLLIILKNCFC